MQSPGGQGQKVDVLLEFGEWLYLTHFPLTDVRFQIEWAVDMLLFTDGDYISFTHTRFKTAAFYVNVLNSNLFL